MNKDLDQTVVTNNFLIEYFPSPDRYYELTHKLSTTEASKNRYREFKEKLNQRRMKSGHSPYMDGEIVEFVESLEGYVLFNKLKR